MQNCKDRSGLQFIFDLLSTYFVSLVNISLLSSLLEISSSSFKGIITKTRYINRDIVPLNKSSY